MAPPFIKNFGFMPPGSTPFGHTGLQAGTSVFATIVPGTVNYGADALLPYANSLFDPDDLQGMPTGWNHHGFRSGFPTVSSPSTAHPLGQRLDDTAITSTTHKTKAEAREEAFRKTEQSGGEHSYLFDSGKYTVLRGSSPNRAPTGIFGDAATTAERDFFGVKLGGHIHPKSETILPSKEDLQLVAAEAANRKENVNFEVGGWLPDGSKAIITIVATYNEGQVFLKLNDPKNVLWKNYSWALQQVRSDISAIEQSINASLSGGRKKELLVQAYQEAASRKHAPPPSDVTVSSLDQVSCFTQDALISSGHHPFLAGQLVSKQTAYARKLALIIDRSLDHEEYLRSFLDSVAELDRIASFFGRSRQSFYKSLELDLSNNDLFVRYRTYLEWYEALDLTSATAKEVSGKFGPLPKASNISEDNFLEQLQSTITYYSSKRPNIKKRSEDLLRDKSGDTLKAEAFRYYEFFLYSEAFSFDFYEELQRFARATGLTLEDIICQRVARLSDSEKFVLSQIEKRGGVTYADFMQMALYDPKYGFYTRAREGNIVGSKRTGKGEFETLPEQFTEFGKGIALDLLHRWKALGKPQAFQVIEMGAGQGTMARDILKTIEENKDSSPEWQAFVMALKYKIVEISPTLITKQRQRVGALAHYIEWIEGSAVDVKEHFPPHSVTGVFLSNELPDAFPVHKVRMVDGKLQEVCIVAENGVLVERESEPSTVALGDFLKSNQIQLAEGESRVINLNAFRWLDSMNHALKEGFIMTFDYGHGGGLNQARLITEPQFRKYGRERNRQQVAFFGVTGEGTALDELIVLTRLMSEGIGQEKMLEALADHMKYPSTEGDSFLGGFGGLLEDLLGSHPFREMKSILKDYVAHPLPQAGDVDITTDADFPSMARHARSLGLRETFFDTQRSYFERFAYVDPQTRQAVDPKFFESASGYKIQVLRKEPASKPKRKQLPAHHVDLLERGRIETVQDVELFLSFLEDLNSEGFGPVARAVRNHARQSGRPLCGLSSDSIFRFSHDHDRSSRFVFDHRNGFGSQINITAGTPLSTLLSNMIDFAPNRLLPAAYQGYVQTFPEIRDGMPFAEINGAVFNRFVKSRTLRSYIEASFALALHDMGYNADMSDVDIDTVRKLVGDGIDALEKMTRTLEPIRTQHQINALRVAASLAQGKQETPESIELQDLFIFEDGSFRFNQQALSEMVKQIWTEATGKRATQLLVALATSIPLQTFAIAKQLFTQKQVDLGKFFELKEVILSHFGNVLGTHIDKGRKSEPKIIETDLGPRIVPEDRGEPNRIAEQSEDSRNLITLFGRYAAYIDHLLRTKPESLQQDHILNFVRTMDPERDVTLLHTLLGKVKHDGYDCDKGDFELARSLYEKGFQEKAHEIFSSWGTRSHRWTPEAVAFLSKHGEVKILGPYLDAHRADLSTDRRYFDCDFTPLAFSLTDDGEAHRLLDQEWAYIKDLLRIFVIASNGNEHFPDKFGEWWSNNRSRFSLEGQPFDVFSSARAGKYKPGSFADLNPAGKWMIHPIRFIQQLLKDPRFSAKAIAMIGEFEDSPMKLELYEQAAEYLPAEWSVEQTKEFFEAWSNTLNAVGVQVAQHDFMEPTGDFQHWPHSHRDDDKNEKLRGKMPQNYTGSRLFHHGTQKMIETALHLAREREGFGKMTDVAATLAEKLTYQQDPSFNYRTWPRDKYDRWAKDVFFYSGNQYASQWASLRLRDDSLDIGEFRKALAVTRPPNRRDYNLEIFPPGSSDEIYLTYIRDVKLYVENMKNMYAVALRFEFTQVAREIYESVQSFILEVAKEVESSYRYNDQENNLVRNLQNFWALQEVLQELMVKDGLNGAEAIFERLIQRIEQDRRGYFTIDSIADAAKELSRRKEYTPFAMRLFKIAADKLGPKRGERDWLSKKVREAIRDSSLSDGQKDEIYYYALKIMWPQGDHPLTHYLGMHDDASELEILIREIFSQEDKFARSKSFLLEKMARGATGMDPLKYGKEIQRDTYYSGFYWELKALAFLAGNFTTRRELLDPQNYEALKRLYSTENEALDALKSIFPEQVRQDGLRGKHTKLPSVAEVEKGSFDARELEEQLTPLLNERQPVAVWQEAFGVLGAWLRHDALEIINRRQKEEEGKKWEDRQEVFIGPDDLNDRGSYQLARRLGIAPMASPEPSAFEQRAMSTLLKAKTAKEATAKAFFAYGVLKSNKATLTAKRLAFELLKSEHLPGYVGHVYEQRIKNATAEKQLEFFNDIILWDHTTPSKERPSVLWAHLFEAEGEQRVRLRERIKHYRADEKNWVPDPQVEEDWWILQHEFSKEYSALGSDQYRVAWVYQQLLKGMRLTERVIHFMGDRYAMDAVNITFLLDNWDRLESLKAEEALAIYRRLYPEGERSWSLEDALRAAKRHFNETKDLFVRFKTAIKDCQDPTLTETENRWEVRHVFELLKTRDSLQPSESTDLRSLLRARFPALGDNEIVSLYDLAINPFQIEEDVRRENNQTIGASKDWWSQYGYQYGGEKIWHKAVLAASGGKLSKEEQDALIVFMYPFSKTYYSNNFCRLDELFPHDVPKKSFGDKKSNARVARMLLPQFAKCSLEELAEIAQNIPAYARINLARSHQMGLHEIDLPESFRKYHDFALFVIKTYLGKLKIGALEQVSQELRGLEPDDALHRFFVLRDMIKPSQLLASRPEVPDRYREVLSTLEDRVSPSDVEEVRGTIQNQLGWQPSEVTLVRNLNAGSMGEVWLVNHRGYEFPLAVKVLTPSKESKIKETITEMKELREVLDWYREISREAAIACEVVDNMINLLENELDFRRDKKNWASMFGFDRTAPDQSNVKVDGTVSIPGTNFHTAMYFGATKNALVMSYVDGAKISDSSEGITSAGERKALVSNLWGYLKSKIFSSANGIYPSDMHSGNLMRTRGTNLDVIIDTGQIGSISDAQRETLAQFLIASSTGADVDQILNLLKQMKHPTRTQRIDEAALRSKIVQLLGQTGDPIDRIRDLYINAPFYGLFIDPAYMSLLKGIMTFQGTALRLDPKFTFFP